MQIVCPACASEYEIPTDRVGPEGRQVRCAACRETWFITPDDVATAQIAEAMAAMGDPSRNRSEDQAALDAWESALAEEGIAPDAPASEPLPEPDLPRPAAKRAKPTGNPIGKRAPKPRASLRSMASTAALGLGLIGVAILALVGRSTVVRAMPQSASLYASLGLPVNLRGIDLVDIAAFQTKGEGATGQLVIEGDLVGVAHGAVLVPPIEVEVRDARDQPIYRWTVPAPRATLEERERARFRASLSAPPAQGRSIQVRFADIAARNPEAAMPKPDGSGQRP